MTVSFYTFVRVLNEHDVRTRGHTVLSLHLELILQSSSCGTCLKFLVLADQVNTPPVFYLRLPVLAIPYSPSLF